MIPQIFQFIEKNMALTFASYTTVWSGLLAQADWTSLWEKGGLALVIIVGLVLIGKVTIPPIANWIKGYLEGLETRNAATQKRWEDRMDQSQANFLAELRDERRTREKTEESFRRMMESHKFETVSAIKEQTTYVAALVDQLSNRPCQLKPFSSPMPIANNKPTK